VVLDPQGRSDFETLRRRLALRRPTSVEHAAKRTPAAIFAFDLLELRGKDVRPLPLLKRKALLKEALRGSERIRYLDHVGEGGHRLFQVAEQLCLEEIVAKHGGAPYRRGRASGWVKIKTATGRAIDAERAKWNE
jgi:bifunctional non-homologous end joining protein LigD